MMRAKETRPTVADRLADGFGLLGGIAILFLAGLVFCDVVGRTFGVPIFGARDIMVMTLAVIAASGFASGATQGVHIAIDALQHVLPPWLRRGQLLLADLISLTILAILSWRSFVGGTEASDFGERTMLLSLPHAPFYFALSLGLGLYALVVVFDIVKQFKPGNDDAE
ncbi:TRAP-type C4-dicarboxylate transport system, small permease component [Nitratireductor aquibiodomus]|uniref:TRAP transporter small permease protein n=1 Tax=Nitratireductor aquibiodomus TaxID=204799 RepID=A0A1H4L2U3_9HYPH|nr:TRAP transporter small permease [Nitratireductor aquibiodomus]SEB65094.1 TRAP-type C4-dicarboxylate transport system, small permease component [Nitratireductor aquibiodomus]